jgi:tetratricopeptide (TPR) repeat protein
MREAARLALLSGESLLHEPLNVWLNITWALITQGESAAAAVLLRRLPPPPRGHGHLLVDAAVQFNVLDLPQEALSCIETARGLGANTLALHYVRGQSLQFLGRIDESVEAYEHALHVHPIHGQTHWAIAQLSRNEGSAERVDRLKRLLEVPGISLEDKAYFGYALFRELDSIGDTGAAWSALANAARMRRGHVNYDGDLEDAKFRAIATATSWLPAAASMSADDIVPIFIVGMPRTGTTLLERILGNHEQVAACGELNDFRHQLRWTLDRPLDGYADIDSSKSIATLDAELLGQRYLQMTSWRRGSARFQIDKNQNNFHYCGLILKALPQARIIHVRRNPIDSCFSNLKEIFEPRAYTYSYDFNSLAQHFRNYRELMRHWNCLAPGKILDVYYERLVTAPDAVVSEVTAFCGLTQRSGLTNIRDNASPVTTASSVQVRQAIHSGNVDGWKRYAQQLEPLARLLETES